MWLFKKKDERKAALDKACKLLAMQIQVSAGVEDFFKKTHTHWSLGYCFGMLQASLEVAEPNAKLSEEDYRSHVGAGLDIVYGDDKRVMKYYETSRRSFNDPAFHDGRLAGSNEYVEVLNKKGDRAYELAKYLMSVEI